MSVTAYTDWQARRGESAAPAPAVPAADDHMVRSIRFALDAAALGRSTDETRELMEQRGLDIQVEEHDAPHNKAAHGAAGVA